MPSADQVPTKSSHSRMLWHKWVVLIAGSTGSALRAVRPPNLHITPVVRRDLVYSCFNLYRPPRLALGDPSQAGPWLDHLHTIFPEDAAHITHWLAQRVQRPADKINH